MKNRELKFRAFDDGKMLSMTTSTNYGISSLFGFLRDDAIIMQYTGREDAPINGKEVWEGDIIENCDTKLLQVVYWHEEKAAWYCRYVDDENRIISLCESLGNLNKVVGNIYENTSLIGYEVVGNIFENPELLEIK